MTLNFQTYATTVCAAVESVFDAVTAVFTAVVAENTDETIVSNNDATSVKFSSHRSKKSFSVCFVVELIRIRVDSKLKLI